MSLLITGGAGKTGRRLARRLRERGAEAYVASRHVEAGRRFDWQDRTTWDAALDGVTGAYLVAPPGDSASVLIAFCEHAQSRAVRRFVLLSASLLPLGGPGQGQVHAWLAANAAEWGVLRPSWFMENFSEGPHRATIRDERCIYSATIEGRVGFVSADDIAAVAAAMLTSTEPPNADAVLTGPEAISYDAAAAILSDTLGQLIRHVRISIEDLAARHRMAGMTPIAAQILAGMDGLIANGAEARITTAVADYSGEGPIAFSDFCRANAGCWSN